MLRPWKAVDTHMYRGRLLFYRKSAAKPLAPKPAWPRPHHTTPVTYHCYSVKNLHAGAAACVKNQLFNVLGQRAPPKTKVNAAVIRALAA